MTKAIENINVCKRTEAGAMLWKKRAPEPELHLWNPRAPELGSRSWKEKLRSGSSAIFTTADGEWLLTRLGKSQWQHAAVNVNLTLQCSA